MRETDLRKKARDIAAIFAEGTEIDRALERAERSAILKHVRAGRPMPMWIDGKVEWVDAKTLLPKPARKK